MSRILLSSAGILLVAISLMSLSTTTSAETAPSLIGTVTNSIVIDAITLDSTISELSGDFSITDNSDVNNFTGNQFTEAQTTISDNIVSSTAEVSQTNNAALTTSNMVNNSTHNFQNSTPFTSVDPASQTPTSNTTLAVPPASDEEEKNSLRQEAASLRIVVIVVSIIAGLGILCIIVLIAWLIIQRRKQNTSLIESGIEMKRQQTQLQDEKWPEMRRISSSEDIDTVSQINQGRTTHSRAHTPVVSSEIYLEPDCPTVGVTSFTPPDNLQYNVSGTYANSNQGNQYYNQSSPDNEYYNQSSPDNEYYNQSSQNNEVYNNIEEELNQASSLPRRQVLNTPPAASSEDIGIYSNFKNVLSFK